MTMEAHQVGHEMNEIVPLHIECLNVLLIEDDPSAKAVWTSMLSNLVPQHNLTHLMNIEEAENVIHNSVHKKAPFDLIISNMFISGSLNAVELWRRVRLGSTYNSEFIIVSSVPNIGYEDLLQDYPQRPSFIRNPLNPNLCKQLISQKLFAIKQKVKERKIL
jgi:hypothetical protein